jgi:hypothetical protein
MDKQTVMSMMKNTVDQNLYFTSRGQDVGGSCWHYWQNWYYPEVIRESYPVYIQEKAIDTGKKAFEIIKGMVDKNFVKLNTVKDFIEIMDFFIKNL